MLNFPLCPKKTWRRLPWKIFKILKNFPSIFSSHSLGSFKYRILTILLSSNGGCWILSQSSSFSSRCWFCFFRGKGSFNSIPQIFFLSFSIFLIIFTNFSCESCSFCLLRPLEMELWKGFLDWFLTIKPNQNRLIVD